jgi:hypothetical protein
MVGPSSNLPATNATLDQARALLATIAGDTSPVRVNVIAGLGAYANLGSPSTSVANGVGYSSPFVPNGERVRFRFGNYYQGDRTWQPLTSGGYIWLEADLSGGTVYVPIIGTKQAFSDLPVAVASGFAAVFDRVPVGANCRLAINFGAIGGSTGIVGTNMFVLN